MLVAHVQFHSRIKILVAISVASLSLVSWACFTESMAQPTKQKSQAYELIRGTIKLGEFNKALFLLDRHAKTATKDPEYYFLRGRILQELKKNSEALASYSVAIYIMPDLVKAYVNRALVKGALGDTQGAIEDLNKALQLQPSNAAALLNRGVTFASLNKPVLALRDFNQAIQLDSRYADAYRNRGIVRYLSNDLQGSCDDWRKSIELGASEVLDWTRSLCMTTPPSPGQGLR